jgi:uncharacterized cupin superfamily protein
MRNAIAVLATCAALSFTPAVLAEEAPRAVRLSSADLGPAIFAREGSETTNRTSPLGAYVTRDFEAFNSPDGHFDAGVYQADGAHRHDAVGPYSVHEFMYFLEGSVRLTAADGEVVEVRAGEALIVPQGWQGAWESPGYTKIYVIYSPNAPAE